MNSETRTCQNCKQNFVIQPDDFGFYEKIQVPPPTFCPSCRLQRRLTWRNERTLYKRLCSLCHESIVAIYPENTPFPVYCRPCWFGDKWNPLDYGQDYNFEKDFFSQFKELLKKVPRLALYIENCENCDYTNQIGGSKNCYLSFSVGIDVENCNYSYRIIFSKDISDSFLILKNENCYEAVESRDSARLYFSQNTADSLDLYFCYDVSSSDNCFMSSNLRRGSYYFRNERLTKEEYKKRFTELDFGSYKKLEQYRKEFSDLYNQSLHRFINSKNIVNSIGQTLSNAKNAYFCFNGSDLENCRYAFLINYGRDCMDLNIGEDMELCYESNTTGLSAYANKFCSDTWPDVRDLEYCDTCRSGVSNLFGCVSLRGKQYCVLNKQYSKKEYEELVPKIREQMTQVSYKDAKGRKYGYGEFFPAELSTHGYNETMAHDWFPLSKEEVLSNGLRWAEEPGRDVKIDIAAADLPDHIKDVDESIVGKTIGCLHRGECNQKCTIGFRLIPSELNIYKANNIALPRLCPNCRHYERLKKFTSYALFDRQCDCDYKTHKNSTSHPHHASGRCENRFQTSYAPDRPEIVYCEQCYQAEVV